MTVLLYTVASFGFVLVYNTKRIFNSDLAILNVVASYIFWQFTVVLSLPMIVGMIISALLTALISFGIERIVYYPLFKSKASLINIRVLIALRLTEKSVKNELFEPVLKLK